MTKEEKPLEQSFSSEDYKQFFDKHPTYNDIDWGYDECYCFANYFFKLGLKSQKVEIMTKEEKDLLIEEIKKEKDEEPRYNSEGYAYRDGYNDALSDIINIINKFKLNRK